MKLADAHCHLSEVAKRGDFTVWLTEARRKGIKFFFSNALSVEEVDWHRQQRIEGMQFSAGIHPLYDAGTPIPLEILNELASTKQIYAIGEIGLDKRNKDLPGQLKILNAQLEIARDYDLPVVWHIVGHLDVFYKLLSVWQLPGIWHGFSESVETLKLFSKFDIYSSLGPALIKSAQIKLLKDDLFRNSYFLLESDAPYNLKSAEPANPLLQVAQSLKTISALTDLSEENLMQKLTLNQQRAFHLR